MTSSRVARLAMISVLVLSAAACGNGGSSLGDSRLGNSARSSETQNGTGRSQRSTIWDLFDNRDDPNTTVEVNKYIWTAALDVLNFLPVQSVDPFTGVITTGYGRPPGGGRAYRATVYVQDPALDARSLKVALQTQGGGAVDPDTVRAVEDAILTRARELRIADSKR